MKSHGLSQGKDYRYWADKRGYIPKIISIDQIFSNMNDD